MPFIRARDGQHVHVRIAGRGEPCVLVHGFGMESRSWLPFVAPLLPRRRFVMPDLRGFGPSHPVPLNRACPLTNYAEDLEDVMEALGLSNVPLVGISMGASTAVQSFRLFGGRRFSRYLHIDQGPEIHNRDGFEHGLFGAEQPRFFTRFRAMLARLEILGSETPYASLPAEIRADFWALFADFASVSFTSALTRESIRLIARREPVMRRFVPIARWQTYMQILRAYLEEDYDMRAAFGGINVPMTVLVGGASRMYPPEGQRSIGRLAPRATVVEVDGAGHYLPFEAPIRFARELARFLGAGR
jgi:pimeloyl-ACP methyl ester carboxylesterase